MSNEQSGPRTAEVIPTASGAKRAPQGRRRFTRAVLRFGTRRLNPYFRSRAERRGNSMFAVLHHRGRRSGRTYATPVVARQTADGFIIALTFGEEADWFQNIRAARAAVVQWNGTEYPVIEPEVVDRSTARPSFHRWERAMVRLMGVERFVRLRIDSTAGQHETAAS